MLTIKMNDQGTTEGSPRWMGIAVVGLAILSLVGVGLAWNAGGHARDAEQALAAQAKTFQASEDGMSQRMAQAERTNAELQSEVNLVGDKLKLTEDQLATARSQVKQSRADYTKKLNDVQSTLATKASADDVKALGTDVNGVKTDLDTTKGSIEQLRGEHGELIARNHEELEQLKRMGERDYYEFTLTAKGQKEHVGQTMIEFRSASAKKHQYTIAHVRRRHAPGKEEPGHQRTHLLLRRRISPADGTGGQPGQRQENLGLLERTQGHCSLREANRKLTYVELSQVAYEERAASAALFFPGAQTSVCGFPFDLAWRVNPANQSRASVLANALGPSLLTDPTD